MNGLHKELIHARQHVQALALLQPSRSCSEFMVTAKNELVAINVIRACMGVWKLDEPNGTH